MDVFILARVAQLVEQKTENLLVGGSSPPSGSGLKPVCFTTFLL